ncbi:MAG: TIGR01777 family protein [Flavobacterium sp. BFFFF2]|nr:MAG: TIGR01777 family protein [Flavobacterium sp. BFFFF2]
MRILITGATGLVGKSLVTALQKKGHTIHYFTTRKASIKHETGLHGYFWNPLIGSMDTDAFQGVEAIVHLAGATISNPWTKAYKQEILESRILGLDLIYTYLHKHTHSIKQLVSASGTGVYPDATGKTYTEADHVSAKGFLGQVVVEWEARAHRFQQLGIQVCCLRTGVVLDPFEGAYPQLAKTFQWKIGSIPGKGTQFFPWIHRADLVEVYVEAIEKQWSGIINAVAPDCITQKQLSHCLKQVYQQPFLFPRIPEFVFRLLLGERADLILLGAAIEPARLIQMGFAFHYPTIKPALEAVIAEYDAKK